MSRMRSVGWSLALLVLAATASGAQPPEVAPDPETPYLLGPGDEVIIRMPEVAEIGELRVRVDHLGKVSLPLAGRLHAAGLTTEQLEAKLNSNMEAFVREPQAVVNVADLQSKPVSVLGAVAHSGVHQLQGRKTLLEILSLAGGLGPDAGSKVNITRRHEWGEIPLPSVRKDAGGAFSVAEVDVKSILDAGKPEENIEIRPYDVITVPRAEMVYVVGAVGKPGGFVLNEKESVSVLRAVSLAAGLAPMADAADAKILRARSDGAAREEIPVNLKQLFAGKAEDTPMLPDDILFVPTSGTKNATLRVIEAAIQVGTGMAIWRR